MAEPGLRIAWFSDLSVGRTESLSTHCSRLLIPKLLQQHSIEVFSDEANVVGSPSIFGAPVSHYLNAYKRHRECPFDLFFYQLEDSRACRFIRGHIGLMPGVVWVHDLFCNDLGPEACHTSPWERSIRQFFDPSLPFADRSKAPHQLWPRAFRETSLCPAVLFSSQWARNEFRRMVSNRLESGNGMHHVSILPVPVEFSDVAASEPTVSFQIATVSVPGIEGRSHKVLPVLRNLTCDWHLTWLVEQHEQRAALMLMHEFGIAEERVTLIAERSVARWSDVVARSHVALHLHTSPFGHVAPFIQTSLARGCPVVTARSAQGEDFPENVVFRVTPGLHESAELQAVFAELSRVQAGQVRARDYGAQGVAYARGAFEAGSIAANLSETLLELTPHISYVMDRWQSLGRRAREALRGEVRDLVAAKMREEIRAYDRIIAPSLKELGWSE